MNLNFKNGRIEIQSGPAHIELDNASAVVDGYVMDFPGEYERKGVFVEVRESDSHLLYVLTIEGKTVIYLPADTTAESLEALRDLNDKDMVIFPANESLWKVIETWEATIIAPYGPKAGEFLTKLGQTVEVATSIRASDFESEATRFVTLG